jgi:TetR/AcrR family transcriptional repressor of nem operon
MPYPAGHREKLRARIVASARRLFNRHGFNDVSIAQIMRGAGLTHGAFYTYFESKSALYCEALACFFTDPNWKNNWDGVVIDPAIGELAPQIVRAYLSSQHYEDVENSCPMVALPTDVARGGEDTKRAFETVFGAMVDMLEHAGKPDHITAQAIAALCVGGMVVARAMVTRERADELRSACRDVALQLGGWNASSVAGKIPRSANAPPARRHSKELIGTHRLDVPSKKHALRVRVHGQKRECRQPVFAHIITCDMRKCAVEVAGDGFVDAAAR